MVKQQQQQGQMTAGSYKHQQHINSFYTLNCMSCSTKIVAVLLNSITMLLLPAGAIEVYSAQ
jgi:hypothetical protein